ncbi:nuclear transport factor 2 family protein [Amycolatopsis sp. YIM 10]|uniref:nuclear transport factor 2 family protein n=1 Tax=Amycolatopsis sp. YIM 10 TaxID=2653857 RepID=UPI00129082EB|nr:nuclear transport factor 2 family protein [Amycolatopsis sp. YIM 10]QFU88191.1 putative PhzA/B-like protein [Amycolatopsis sp. YIM 10]
MPRTARDLVDEALRRILAKDMTGFAELWAAGGVLEFPFAAAGYPDRIEGRDAVREYLRDYNDRILPERVVASEIHDVADADRVIAEFEVAGTIVASGQPYRMRYVAVITAKNGEIAHYRDYWSPLAAAEAMGGADELMAFGNSTTATA